jgi:hypothetical protein
MDFFAVSDHRKAYTRSNHGERATRQDCDQPAYASLEAIVHRSSLLSSVRTPANRVTASVWAAIGPRPKTLKIPRLRGGLHPTPPFILSAD